jgi:uncharacterized protein
MESIAIIGTGISGMGCAHLLRDKYQLSLFEQQDYIGGHTNTISVKEDEIEIFFDTGFMVFNYETYPLLCGLFREIQAPVIKTDMSFSVQYQPDGLEYCGSGLNGLFAQRKNLFNIPFIKMLIQISRFNKKAVEILEEPYYHNYTLKEFVNAFGFGDDMFRKYLVPMSAAVWSAPMEKMADFPALTLIRFFKNHGFLGLNTQYQWYTLEKGSQSYRSRLIEPFRNNIRLNTEVRSVERSGDKALVHVSGASYLFDKVVFACHADDALRLLSNPSPNEKLLLKPFTYQKNIATVHTDESVMPLNKKVWSSWNYRIEQQDGRTAATTIYWMNRLQRLAAKKNYFVSINAIPGSIDKNKFIREIIYEHPLFDLEAVNTQKELQRLNRQGVFYYCGSYFKYGFHEDAYASAVELSKTLLHA